MIICQIILCLILIVNGYQATNLPAKDRCPIQMFRCLNEKCIPEVFKCNGRDECGDNSDEQYCPKDYYICKNGEQIRKTKLCDGKNDCDDDEEFKNCKENKCHSYDMMCKSIHNSKVYQCLNSDKICNGNMDCLDGSDETSAACAMMKKRKEAVCNEMTPFQCANKKLCLAKRYVCDQVNDCLDKSDEVNCTHDKPNSKVNITKLPEKNPCDDGEFYCGHESTTQCVPNSYKCDGSYDCETTRLDEKNCKVHECPGHMPLKCGTNNECFKVSMRCDGTEDCSDGTDEKGCVIPKKQVTCDTYKEFKCFKKNQCIKRSQICDNVDDCGDKSDERPNGKQSHCYNGKNLCSNNGGCDHYCSNYFYEKRCHCKPGFKIALHNSSQCIDIDECKDQGKVGSSKCAHLCHNNIGSYSCSCQPGFIKDPTDSHLCMATGEQFLLYAANHSIRELRMVHSQLLDVINKDQLSNSQLVAIDLDYDYANSLLFWSEPEPVPRINMFDMTSKRNKILLQEHSNNLTTKSIEYPVGLTYDWINKLLFYTDNGLKEIGVINITNHARKVLHKFDRHTKLRSIVVHPFFRKIYFVDWGMQPRIISMDYDGKNHKNIVSDGLVTPSWLTLDFYTNILYWADTKARKISKINLKTGKINVIMSHLKSYVFGIDKFENYIYYTDWLHNQIRKFDLMSGVEVVLVTTPKPMGLKIMHPLAQPTFNIKGVCAEHDCQFICLPNSQKPFQCICPESSQWDPINNNCTQPSELKPYQWIQVKNQFMPKSPRRQIMASPSTAHKVAGPILSFVFILLIVCIIVGILIYRNYVQKVIRNSTNFPNPTYLRRTATSEIEMVSNDLNKPLPRVNSYSDYPPNVEVQFGVGEALIPNQKQDPEVYNYMNAYNA